MHSPRLAALEKQINDLKRVTGAHEQTLRRHGHELARSLSPSRRHVPPVELINQGAIPVHTDHRLGTTFGGEYISASRGREVDKSTNFKFVREIY